uniref:Chloride channel protein n=1 Tax=Plectus sambesii TaxID=2011161 RepID=A0A914W961_9BILA
MPADIYQEGFEGAWESAQADDGGNLGLFACSSGESLRHFWRRQYHNLTHFLVEDWFLSAVLGIIMAVLSVSMDFGIEWCQDCHVDLLNYFAQYSTMSAYGAWVGYALVLVVASAIFVRLVGPQAVGSGIPEVKTIMRGVLLKEYVTFRVLVSKMIGLILSLGSGLPIGKEGPFVHIAAVVATLLSKLTAGFQKSFYRNESRYSEMLAAACAVAIACTLSAPVGGVLYSIEATSVFFAIRNYWRAFFAACCSAITFRLLRVFSLHSHKSVIGYFQTEFPNDSFFPEELPYFALLGILCGFLGASFIFIHRQVALFVKDNQTFKKINNLSMLIFPMFVTLIVSSLTYPLGFGRMIAGALKQHEWLEDFFSDCVWHLPLDANSTKLICDPQLLENWTGGPDGDVSIFVSLLTFVITFYCLSIVCYTLPVPSGIFLPSFVIGAAIGRLIGEVVAYWHPEGIKGVSEVQIYPGIYAIVGAAAFTGAVTHAVSVSVIAFEMTGQITFLLPVLIAVLFANAICSYLQPSIYDSAIKIKRLPYLPEIPPSRSSVHQIKAEQIMVVNVKFITQQTTYRQLRDLLASAPNLRSFPVVADNETKILLGSIAREYLIRILRQKLYTVKVHVDNERRQMSYEELSVSRNIETRNQRSMYEREPSFSGVPRSTNALSEIEEFANGTDSRNSRGWDDVNRLWLRQSQMLDQKIDLEESIDQAPFQLVEGTSLYTVHNLFNLLALNHAYVTHAGRLVGVISLTELRNTLENIYVLGAVPVRPTAAQRRAADEANRRMAPMTLFDSNLGPNSIDDEEPLIGLSDEMSLEFQNGPIRPV